jgi:hypothetical protein
VSDSLLDLYMERVAAERGVSLTPGHGFTFTELAERIGAKGNEQLRSLNPDVSLALRDLYS